MTHSERLDNLDLICRYLLDEHPQYHNAAAPHSMEEKQRLMRSLLNIRPPRPVHDGFIAFQGSGSPAFVMLPKLPGTCRGERIGVHRFLLHIHRRVPISE